jgi:hypothetical protein
MLCVSEAHPPIMARLPGFNGLAIVAKVVERP